ncbi:MAG: ComEC/Rec2 family competence protein, partial [Planctomycetia bacterium]
AVAPERLVRPGAWGVAAAAWAGIGMIVAVGSPLLAPRHAPLRAVVAGMGHGCGIVVRSPTCRVVVYDAGRLGAAAAARRGMEAVLWSEGVARIDSLVISHADTDHFNAVPDLLERFAVGEIVVSQSFLESDAFAARDLLRQVYERRIPVRCVRAGDEIPCDPLCRVRVLHHDAAAGDDNQTSLVLSVESAGRRMLLTGDIEGDALDAFVAGDPDTCDVLLAPHHGSATSLPAEIARSTRPAWVVVSGPGGARWPEVRDAYETAPGPARPARIVKTGGPDGGSGARGAVAVSLSAAGVTVRQFSGGRWREVPPPFRPRRPSPDASAMRPPPGGRS